MISRFLRFVAVFLLAAPVLAVAVPLAKPEDIIRARLAAAMKGVEITSITPSTTIAGLYEVVLDGAETAYVTPDGKYLLSGDLYQVLPDKGMVNVTDQSKGVQRRAALAKVDPAKMITFPAKGKEKSEIFVFTDVDCGYCRKFHLQVPQLNQAGITVHYLAFPRSGPDTDASRKMDAVWCAADRNKALTDAKRGTVPTAAPVACKSPVTDEYRMGVAMGVQGTPAVFMADGTQIGGYIPAGELIAQLGVK